MTKKHFILLRSLSILLLLLCLTNIIPILVLQVYVILVYISIDYVNVVLITVLYLFMIVILKLLKSPFFLLLYIPIELPLYLNFFYRYINKSEVF